MKLSFGIVFLLVALAMLYAYWPNEFSSNSSTNFNTEEAAKESASQYNIEGNNYVVLQDTNIDTNSYVQCDKLIRASDKISRDWAREAHRDWEHYLEQGYSLNDLTLAIEHFLNGNFAESFRANYLRKDAPLTLKNDAYSNTNGYGMGVHRDVPNAVLEGLSSMTASEKALTLREQEVLVDDVAYFMTKRFFTDEDILLLIDRLEDPTATVGFDEYAALSLIDYAAIAARPQIVETLLARGVSPTHDDYLGTTMEWALVALGQADMTGKREQAVKVIKLLVNRGAKARFSEQTFERVTGNLPRHTFAFDTEAIQALIVDYNLDLSQIQSQPKLVNNRASALIDNLQIKKQAYLAEQLKIPELIDTKQSCVETMQNRLALWQAKSAKRVIEDVIAETGDDKKQILKAFGTIDPSLVDVYERQLANQKSASVSNTLLQRIEDAYQLFEAGNVPQGIDYLLSYPIPENLRFWLLLKVLNFGEQYYNAVLSSPLQTDRYDFAKLRVWRMLNADTINKLTQAGASLDNADSLGKTLVHYAAESHRVALLEYLLQEQFPYILNRSGQDPLHVALNINPQAKEPTRLIDTVATLMEFRPNIDEFHIKRMKLIQTFYPQLYDEIATAFPVLQVSDDTALPAVQLDTSFIE